MKKSMLTLSVLMAIGIAAQAATIPLNLPRPDGKPGNPKKPVKVYILAGQSNMVGMGDISGCRPQYSSVFLSADPAILPGRMPAGSNRGKGGCRWSWKGISAVATHAIYQSADPKAATGAVVAIHKGAFDPSADYAKLKPAKTDKVALGTVTVHLPTLKGPCTQVVTAFIDVPADGNYMVHAGYEDSTYAVATVDGKEVYRKDPGGKPVITKITLEAGKRYPVQITYFKGGSAAFWLEQVDLEGKGDLVYLTKTQKKFPYLIDDSGNWTVRNDVYFQEARVAEEGRGCPLTATSNGRSIGPEVGFGYVMGDYHGEQVLLIKTAMGNRALCFDFRPPSSGRNDPDNNYEGLEYRLMIKGVHATLDNIAKVVPNYQGQGYEIAGFGWFQGHKDGGKSKEEYEENLVNLINDVRKEFKTPKMPAVVATVGFHGYRLPEAWQGVWEAQMAVGDPKQHPEFAGTVASVDIRDFWREVEESPRGQDYHYNRNPESYLLVGEAMGRAMVRMDGGKAEVIPTSDREARAAAEDVAEAAKPVPTEEQLAAATVAVRPMLLDGLLARFVMDPRSAAGLKNAVKGSRPAKQSGYLDDPLDQAVAYYQEGKIHDYDWKPFGDFKDATWDCFSFDMPNSPYKVEAGSAAPKPKLKKGEAPPSLEIPLPDGMTDWFMPDFDSKKAGWKSEPAPFGPEIDEMLPTNVAWLVKYPCYPMKRELGKTICDKDVLLIRKSLELPPLKDDCRYRIVVKGSIHDNSGEGYTLYLNGKQLAESKTGVTAWRRAGVRGTHVWTDIRDEFKGGKITIAVANFPMNNWNPDGWVPFLAPLRVWIEEQKIPPTVK